MQLTFETVKREFDSAKDPTRGKAFGRRSRGDVRIIKCGKNYGIRLYATVIVTFLPNGDVTLNSGGYKTPTTKGWINEILGQLPFNDRRMVCIAQRKYEWFVETADRQGIQAYQRVAVPFFNGIVITREGTVKS